MEIAHIFKLGSQYAGPLGAQIQNPRADNRPLEMGCYGLGLTRLMAAIVEQRRDRLGIVWPEAVSPYLAVIVPLQAAGSEWSIGEQLYRELSASGLDVLLDDSDAEYEDRIRYADLLGIPLKVVLTEDRKGGAMVEIRERASSGIDRVPLADLKGLLLRRADSINGRGDFR
jgi:prolyl-tRNA synthetase